MATYTPSQRMQTYILQGYGAIAPQWVQHCLHLFKQEQVNLRKVVLLKNGTPECFSMLEIHFLLPQTCLEGQELNASSVNHDDTGNNPEHPFLQTLQLTLAQQAWQEQSIRLSLR